MFSLHAAGSICARAQDIPECTITFTVLYGFLCGFAMFVRSSLQTRRKYHHTVKLVVFAVWASCIGLLFNSIAAIHYAVNGTDEGYRSAYVIAIIFLGFADQGECDTNTNKLSNTTKRTIRESLN